MEFQCSKRLHKERVDELYERRYGEAYLTYRGNWKTAGPDNLPALPLHIDVEVVDECCLRCKNCFRNKRFSVFGGVVNSGLAFDLEAYKRIINELAGHTMAINFGFAGECTLRPDLLFAMIDYAGLHGFIDKRTISNGFLLTREIIDRVVDSELDFFSISVDAGTATTYRDLKGVGKFDHVLNAVRYFHDSKKARGKDFPLLRTSFYVCEENKDEVGIFRELFGPLSDFIDLQGFYDYGNTDWVDVGKKACVYPFRRLGFWANGDVTPCCSLLGRDLVIGNCFKDSVWEVWRSDAINNLRVQLKNRFFGKSCTRCLTSIRDDILDGVDL